MDVCGGNRLDRVRTGGRTRRRRARGRFRSRRARVDEVRGADARGRGPAGAGMRRTSAAGGAGVVGVDVGEQQVAHVREVDGRARARPASQRVDAARRAAVDERRLGPVEQLGPDDVRGRPMWSRIDDGSAMRDVRTPPRACTAAEDLDVAAASAQVARQREPDLVVRRLRAFSSSSAGGRQDHAGRAEAALEGVRVGERALHRVVAAEPLGGGDRASPRRAARAAGRRRSARPSTSAVHAPQTPIPHVSRTDRIPNVAAQDREQALGRERVGLHLGPVQVNDPHRHTSRARPLDATNDHMRAPRHARDRPVRFLAPSCGGGFVGPPTRVGDCGRGRGSATKRRASEPGSRRSFLGVAAIQAPSTASAVMGSSVDVDPERAERVADRSGNRRYGRLAEPVHLGARRARRARG